MEFNCYGESLDSTPDFLFMKKHYEESLLDIFDTSDNNFLEENNNLAIFVDPSNLQENNISQTNLNKKKDE